MLARGGRPRSSRAGNSGEDDPCFVGWGSSASVSETWADNGAMVLSEAAISESVPFCLRVTLALRTGMSSPSVCRTMGFAPRYGCSAMETVFELESSAS